jgi:hypothetical protein
VETHEIKTTAKVLSRKTLLKGTTKRIEVNKYWDSHGNEVDWGQDVENFDSEKEFEIIEEQVERDFGFSKYTFDEWHILVDGKRFDKEFELTGYKNLKTKLVLHACVGAG